MSSVYFVCGVWTQSTGGVTGPVQSALTCLLRQMPTSQLLYRFELGPPLPYTLRFPLHLRTHVPAAAAGQHVPHAFVVLGVTLTYRATPVSAHMPNSTPFHTRTSAHLQRAQVLHHGVRQQRLEGAPPHGAALRQHLVLAARAGTARHGDAQQGRHKTVSVAAKYRMGSDLQDEQSRAPHRKRVQHRVSGAWCTAVGPWPGSAPMCRLFTHQPLHTSAICTGIPVPRPLSTSPARPLTFTPPSRLTPSAHVPQTR